MFTDIRLQHFRSYSDESLELSDGVNIIVGPNAGGKTTLLEALLLVTRGGSYKAHDIDLIAFDENWARIDAHTNTETRSVKILREGTLAKKQFVIDGRQFARLNQTHSLPVVLFEPDHLQLLTGSPERRRLFLDDLTEQTNPSFSKIRQYYKRALQQRNALLKNSHLATKDQLFVWNIRLSELGGQIARERMKLINDLNEKISNTYSEIADKKHSVRLEYQTRCSTENYDTDLLHKLETKTEIDHARGFTMYGPHRDDMTVILNNHPAQDTASRGETRTLLLALKMRETIILEEARNIRPALLLDDVFSELDGKRRKALTSFLKSYQAFITTTDADVIAKNFAQNSNIIAV